MQVPYGLRGALPREWGLATAGKLAWAAIQDDQRPTAAKSYFNGVTKRLGMQQCVWAFTPLEIILYKLQVAI